MKVKNSIYGGVGCICILFVLLFEIWKMVFFVRHFSDFNWSRFFEFWLGLYAFGGVIWGGQRLFDYLGWTGSDKDDKDGDNEEENAEESSDGQGYDADYDGDVDCDDD